MKVINYLPQLSVAIGLVSVAVVWLRTVQAKREIKLEKILAGAFTGSTIPTGFALLWSAFDPSIIQKLEGLNIHIAVAGIALLFIAFKSLIAD